MIHNQKGFTYPLTLSILLTFLIFFSIQTEQLLTERKMFHETKIILQQEYYMLSSIKKIEESLQSGEDIPIKGSFTYDYGIMDYQMDVPSGGRQKITFTLHLNSGQTGFGYGYYDMNEKKIIKWIEKN